MFSRMLLTVWVLNSIGTFTIFIEVLVANNFVKCAFAFDVFFLIITNINGC